MFQLDYAPRSVALTELSTAGDSSGGDAGWGNEGGVEGVGKDKDEDAMAAAATAAAEAASSKKRPGPDSILAKYAKVSKIGGDKFHLRLTEGVAELQGKTFLVRDWDGYALWTTD